MHERSGVIEVCVVVNMHDVGASFMTTVLKDAADWNFVRDEIKPDDYRR
jgi:hypothetical protein